MAQFHIIHAGAAAQYAEMLAGALEREGYSTTWDAQQGLLAAMSGKTLPIAKTCANVALWSREILSAKYTREAAISAMARGELIEVVLDPVASPIEGEKPAPLDFFKWNGETNTPLWKAFMARVREVAGRPTGKLPLKEEAPPAMIIGAVAAAVATGMVVGGVPASHIQSNSLAALGPESISTDDGYGLGGPNVRVHEPRSARDMSLHTELAAHFERLEPAPEIKIVHARSFAVVETTELASADEHNETVASASKPVL